VSKNKVVAVLAMVGLGLGAGCGGDGEEQADCSNPVVLNADITENRTLPRGTCYLVTANVVVQAGAHLEVEPAVTVMFAANRSLGVQGSIAARGEAGSPVVFTGEQSVPGFWEGLRIDRSASEANVLEHVVIEYGGGRSNIAGHPAWNLLVAGHDDLVARLRINHTTLRHSAETGLVTYNDVLLEGFVNNTITSNDRPVFTSLDMAGQFKAASTYAGNEQDMVVVEGSRLRQSQTWEGLDASYYLPGDLSVEAQLTLGPGVILVFGSRASLDIEGTSGGELVAEGTADGPIVFTGLEQQPGYWKGIEFDRTTNQSVLRHAIIEYAGAYSDVALTPPWSLRVHGDNVDHGHLRLENVVLRHGAGAGIVAQEYVTLTCDGVVTESHEGDAMELGEGVSCG
jgi:hypothetical protein